MSGPQNGRGSRYAKLVAAAAAMICMSVGFIGPPATEADVVPNADFEIVSQTVDVRHAKLGQELTFTTVAINNGPDAADFSVNEQGSNNLAFASETCDRGISPDTPACEYGIVQPGDMVTTTIVLQVQETADRRVDDKACVFAIYTINDPNPANDCLTSTVKIVGKRTH